MNSKSRMGILTRDEAEAAFPKLRTKEPGEGIYDSKMGKEAMSIRDLLESAPVKKYNTEDYEYLRGIDERRTNNERRQNAQLDRELREFRRMKEKLAVEKEKVNDPRVRVEVPKSVISRSTVSSLVRVRKRSCTKPET